LSSEGAEPLSVRPVRASELVELRRRVLRGGDPNSPARDDRDDDDGALHVGGFLGERLVASASWFLAPSPVDGDLSAYQLRFMATEVDVQGRGYGSLMLDQSTALLRARGAQQLWAYARDSALGFYRATGWSILEGSQDVSHETQLPHTVIYKALGRARRTT
jgi:GNAT superfamily N-acetyltransferase